MKNYKININRPKVTREEISSRSDFDAVLKNLQQPPKPFYKTGWFGSGVTIVIALVLLYFFMPKEDQAPVVKEQIAADSAPSIQVQHAAGPFIAPPLKNLDVPFEKFTVSSGRGAELKYKTGSRIIVPANVFVDASGKTIKGEVELRYREFHDAVDFFVSGIPMTYDSAGRRYYFESAGMMDVQAYQDGKPVMMAAGKNIKVEMSSNRKGDYSLYQLDTVVKNWIYEGKNTPQIICMDLMASTDHQSGPNNSTLQDPASQQGHQNFSQNPQTKFVADTITIAQTPVLEKIKKEIEVINNELTVLNGRRLLAPRKANPDRIWLNMAPDSADFPELAIYRGMKFEVTEDYKDFKKEYFDIEWESGSLSELEKGVKYNWHLVKDTIDINVPVYPVFEGKNYENARLEHAKKFQESQLAIANKKLELKRKVREYEQQFSKLAERMKQEFEALHPNLVASVHPVPAARECMNEKIVRVFNISGLGIWNCDNKTSMPHGNKVNASFVDAAQNKLNFTAVFLVEKDRNALFNYHNSGFNELAYNPHSNNMLLGVTSDGKLAVFRYADFRNLADEAAPYAFKMEVAARDFKSMEDIKSFVDI